MLEGFENSKVDDGKEDVLAGTFYNIATEEMKRYIEIYLELTRQTNGLTNVKAEHIRDIDQKIVVLGGIGSLLNPDSVTSEVVALEWERMRAVPFDIERAVTKGVYIRLRSRSEILLNQLERDTEGFTKFSSAYIIANPHMLPILQRLAGISSKAQLKERIGNVSDNVVSVPAARKLSQLLSLVNPGTSLGHLQILQSIEPTLEGIVRDLVGRVLLESVVANALDDANVPYKKESEYRHIKGVIYDFRADFVTPEDVGPKAFIEVRKSSSRHASLYAKDKMFSSINWKGRNKELLAIIVVEGP